MNETTRRIAGCDLGKATARFVLGSVASGGQVEIELAETAEHLGQPLAAFREWYSRRNLAGCAALGATGVHADELTGPVLSGLPEEACIEAALRCRSDLIGPLNIVNVGARGYSVFVRGADDRCHYLENDKCSSGTGETMVKIAGRFGLSIAEADQLAVDADQIIPITARCSVFAKSEMTHFGNQGRPAGALFAGYFAAVANYVAALLARARTEGPVLLIGGGLRIDALVSALRANVGGSLVVPDEALTWEARGAALLAAQQLCAEEITPLPQEPAAVIEPKQRRCRPLAPASLTRNRVRQLSPRPVPPGAEGEAAVLGLDLGSTGSKAVLTSIASGEPVLDLYDRTRGNPIDAAQRLIRDLLTRAASTASAPDVRAIAVTGSGREAVATVLRAAYPELCDQIHVVNEIVAHAAAAIHCDEESGKSLSIVEIGGQDAKFIQIVDGQIIESDMNKACSAGTGSFLEEQAVFYGIDHIAQLTELAQQATRPPDLGLMCTVFVAETAAEARNEGYSIPDLFAGFQYSVIHNYINRVMGQRTFGDRIFFQGKPATGPSLAWTLAAVAERDVIVPPNPGAMGAWGVGLSALTHLDEAALDGADPIDLRRCLGAEIVERDEMRCRDKECATLCTIDKTTVAVGGKRQAVFSGGSCPKFEISTAARPKLPKEAPSAVDERRVALKPYLVDEANGSSRGPIDIPMVSTCAQHIPWLVTLIRKLGYRARVLQPDRTSLARGEELCYSFDACAPVKVGHGVLADAAGTVFFPKLVTVDDRDGCRGRSCPMEQGLPELTREALQAQRRLTGRGEITTLHPNLFLEEGLASEGLCEQLEETGKRLGADQASIRSAIDAAALAQREHEAALGAIGRRTLDYGRAHGIPVVVLCGPIHVVHDPVINAGIPRLLRDNGVLTLTMDCYPVPPHIDALPRVRWADSNRALRIALACRERGNAFPILLSSFGCGPASFIEQIFAALMEGYPHTTLETDGHGGTAGYVTRVQAFLHTVRQYAGGSRPAAPERVRLLDKLPRRPLTEELGTKVVMLPISDRLGPAIAAAYRSVGLNAQAAPPADAETLAIGRRDCSGKECLPYQIIWGAFRRHLAGTGEDEQTLLIQISGDGQCRNCLFSVKDQISLAQLGLRDRVRPRHFSPEAETGVTFFAKVWVAMVCWDIFFQLGAYLRPQLRDRRELDRLYHLACDELERVVEQPIRSGWRGLSDASKQTRQLFALLDRTSEAFARVARQSPNGANLRTVFLSGDIYTRVDQFASDSLIIRLNDLGLRVLVEPTLTMSEYLAEERLNDLFEAPTTPASNAISKNSMQAIRHQCYGRVQRHHPWLPMPDIKGILRAADDVFDQYPQGEARTTIGSVVHAWREQLCDGVVIASPWGCGPALVAESLLRHRRDIPIAFVYFDGSPIDERRLNAFAFRMKRSLPRATPRSSMAGPWLPRIQQSLARHKVAWPRVAQQ